VSTTTTAKTGRPSVYSEKIAEAIVDGLMDGLSMVKVCELDGMPNRRTVLRWMEKDEAFAARCARARELQADLMDDKINDLIESCTKETAEADRIKLSGMQWRAEKLMPKKYGSKQENTVNLKAEIHQTQAPELSRAEWLALHGLSSD
jgi:hypothetical protein